MRETAREVVCIVIDGVVRAELERQLRAIVGARRGDYLRPNHVLGDLEAISLWPRSFLVSLATSAPWRVGGGYLLDPLCSLASTR